MEKFVLITKGVQDSNNKGIIRLPPTCYDRVLELKRKTGMSMGRILEQCVDFALDHLVDEEYGEDDN